MLDWVIWVGGGEFDASVAEVDAVLDLFIVDSRCGLDGDVCGWNAELLRVDFQIAADIG